MELNKLSMVGLAFRAGKTLAGTAACEKGLKFGNVKLLLIQDDVSQGSKDHFAGLCERYHTEMMTIKIHDDIGAAIGRSGIKFIGITDKGFADAIRNNYDGGSGKE